MNNIDTKSAMVIHREIVSGLGKIVFCEFYEEFICSTDVILPTSKKYRTFCRKYGPFLSYGKILTVFYESDKVAIDIDEPGAELVNLSYGNPEFLSTLVARIKERIKECQDEH